MKQNTSIQVKSAFLLLVFILNNLVGFACAIGIDMSFNVSHHHGEEKSEIHVHADGQKHHHENKSSTTHSHGDEKNNCCHDQVVKISQADKSVPQPGNYISPVFFTALVSAYYSIDIFYHSQVTPKVKYFVRSYHPPIPDIRIAIQSFQI